MCRVRTQFRKEFTTWFNQLGSVVQGEDAVPETVHHVVVSIDPRSDSSWKNYKRPIQTDGVHASDRLVSIFQCFAFSRYFSSQAVQQTRRTCYVNSASYLNNSVVFFYFHLKIILTVYFMLVSPSLEGSEKYPYRLEVNHNKCPPSVPGTSKTQKLLFFSLIFPVAGLDRTRAAPRACRRR